MSGYKGDLDPLDRLGHHWDHLLEVDTQERLSVCHTIASKLTGIACFPTFSLHDKVERSPVLLATDGRSDAWGSRRQMPLVTPALGSAVRASHMSQSILVV